ncbi:MAG: BamA/TamA family outer membrane protein [Candidatus Neomarinimicrobiota bacterium]
MAGQQPIVSAIEFKGHLITKDYIIEREIQHPIDASLDSAVAHMDRERIYNLGIFADVTWRAIPLEDLTVILEFKVIETSLRILPGGGPVYEEDYGWSFGGMLRINNFRGRNEKFMLGGSTGARRAYFFTFNNPWIAGDHVSLDVTSGKSITAHPFLPYERNVTSAEINLGRYFGYNHKARVGFEWEKKTFSNDEDTLEYYYIAPQGSYIYDTRDIYRDPSKGILIVQGFYSHVEFDSDKQNLWWSQSYSFYHSLVKRKRKLTAAFNVSYLTAFGDVDEVWISWLGGVKTVRGWSIPNSTIYTNGDYAYRFGNHFAIISTELRQTIIPTSVFTTDLFNWKQEYGLSAIAFVDVGFINRDRKKLFNELPIAGIGFGFRIPAPMIGTIGFDYGWGYRDGQFIDQVLHLVIGQKF